MFQTLVSTKFLYFQSSILHLHSFPIPLFFLIPVFFIQQSQGPAHSEEDKPPPAAAGTRKARLEFQLAI
jgi:hypothetical protein